MDTITFSQVTKSFGAVRAVRGIDLTIGAGQTVAMLGANGAGKSTSIGLLLGLVRPDAGHVGVFGLGPGDAVGRGWVGAMLQDGALVPGLTVGEVVAFVRRRYPEPLALDEILSLAGLTDLAGRRADRLSGGQAQRVRFAMAIAGAPRLLVLDEPTSAMDVEARRAFWAGMRSYAAGGRTIVFATHHLDEADEHSDRVIVLADGAVVADGSPSEIKARAGGRAVRFDLGGQSPAGLDLLPGVTAVELHGDRAALQTADVDVTMEALYGSGLRVRGLDITSAALEDAFLSLVGTN